MAELSKGDVFTLEDIMRGVQQMRDNALPPNPDGYYIFLPPRYCRKCCGMCEITVAGLTVKCDSCGGSGLSAYARDSIPSTSFYINQPAVFSRHFNTMWRKYGKHRRRAGRKRTWFN